MNTTLCNYYTEFKFNQCFPNINNCSIFNFNVRSLPKNIDTVHHFLGGMQHNFPILSFTETWHCDYNNTIHNFIGYSHVHKLIEIKHSGWWCIKVISREYIKIDRDLGDILAIEIHTDELNTKYNIISITLYRHPNIGIFGSYLI